MPLAASPQNQATAPPASQRGGPAAPRASQPGGQATGQSTAAVGRWDHAAYVVKERRMTLGRQYTVLDGSGRQVAYCKQKMFRLKEDIRFYTDASMGSEVFRIAARKVLDFRANLDIIDSATGRVLGSFRRKGLKSLVKDEWTFYGPDGQQVGTLHEQGAFRAFFRRWGDIAATFIPARYKLFLGLPPNERFAAVITERFQLWGDTFDVQRDPSAKLDGRLLIGLVVLTDALGVGGAGA